MDWMGRFLDKSFSKLAPNVSVSNQQIGAVLETAALSNDFLENTADKMGNHPNADSILVRIKDSSLEQLRDGFLFVLEEMIALAETRFRKRKYTLAIDTHNIAFYGKLEGIWIHGYRLEKGSTGSFKFITISIVIGEAKFVLHALPVQCGKYTEDLILEMLTWVKKRMRVDLVLFDRGFYSAATIHTLQKINIKYIIFAPQNKKNKKFLAETPEFSNRFVSHVLEYKHDKTSENVNVKIVILKDFVDFKSLRIYDWIFATNLSNLQALSYVKIYKKRWGIETSYRILDTFKILTTSKNIVVRYFLFLTVILLYNIWKFYNLLVESQITFQTFLYSLFLSQLNINHITLSKELLNPLDQLQNP